jgi:putative ABC transport system substrate-binding protein
MKRREFIAGLGSTATWPVVATAQQRAMPVIGFLNPGDENGITIKTYFPLFTQRLAELGWVDGRNLRIELRLARGNIERMRMLARELVDSQPDVIVVTSGAGTKIVQAQTRTIPIVFVYAGDPIANGIVTNIARPEGNTTGVTDLFPSIGGKWVELLKEVKPDLARVALVFTPDFSGSEVTAAAIEAAAEKIGVQTIRITIHSSAEITPGLDAFGAAPHGGIISVPPIAALPRAVELINQAALRHQLPAIFSARENAADGGLMSYGAVVSDLFRRGAPEYVNRILRGAKPGNLPVQFSTKFELVVNLKTAKAIGLTIPAMFLLRADEVIE